MEVILTHLFIRIFESNIHPETDVVIFSSYSDTCDLVDIAERLGLREYKRVHHKRN